VRPASSKKKPRNENEVSLSYRGAVPQRKKLSQGGELSASSQTLGSRFVSVGGFVDGVDLFLTYQIPAKILPPLN